MARLARVPAFTLIELLVVVGIIAVLLAIATPVVIGMRGRGEAAKCLGNLRQLGVALNGYLADHDQRMPSVAMGREAGDDDTGTIVEALAPYAGGAEAFRCPADKRLWRATGTSYFWNPALNGQRANALRFFDLTDAPSRIPVLSDKEGWHYGGGPKVNILYADGHATRGLNLSLP